MVHFFFYLSVTLFFVYLRTNNSKYMASQIIGRLKECAILKDRYDSDKAELIAVYGRRRVGKTFLIKNYFKDRIDFYVTGIFNGTRQEQLMFFNRQLREFSGLPYPLATSWFDAFDQLRQHIMSLKKERTVIFMDEFPWLDSPRSGFMKAFDLFWNSWASERQGLKMIVCGSATTWMMSHLIGDRGGLHNRVTCRIRLAPFNLAETEAFLKANGIDWNRYQIAEAYMIMGGIPYYLQMLQKGFSLSQNIDRMFFSENAEMRDEYELLFRSLFKDASIYLNTVALLGRKAKGMTRAEIMSALKIPEGGNFSQVLENLCNCDFIRKYSAFGKKERDVMYQLSDFYTLFFLKFVKGRTIHDENLWSNMIDSPERRSWNGYSFEQLCLHHVPQIKSRLGISGIQTSVCSWSTAASEGHKGGQIDLVIDRKDQVINLCEMKFLDGEYSVDKADEGEERIVQTDDKDEKSPLSHNGYDIRSQAEHVVRNDPE